MCLQNIRRFAGQPESCYAKETLNRTQSFKILQKDCEKAEKCHSPVKQSICDTTHINQAADESIQVWAVEFNKYLKMYSIICANGAPFMSVCITIFRKKRSK